MATIEVLPNPLELSVGGTGTLTAVARTSSGSGAPTTFSWSSQTPAIADVSSSGLVTAKSPGTTLVIARSGTVQGAAIVNVRQGAAVSLEVVPANATITVGASQAFSVVARDLTGAVVAAPPVTWSSSLLGVASITPAGVAVGLANGTTQIGATAGGLVAAPATLVVGSPAQAACDNIAGIEVFRLTLDLEWAHAGTIPGNRQVKTDHRIHISTDLTRVSVDEFAIWEGTLSGTASVTDSETNLNSNPPTTTRYDGQGAILARPMGIDLPGALIVDLATCTYHIEVTPWINGTITDPSGSKASLDWAVGTVYTDRQGVGAWRSLGLTDVVGNALGVHSPTWFALNADLGAYLPQPPGAFFFVGQQGPGEPSAGGALVTWTATIVR